MNADGHLSEVCVFLVFFLFYSWGNREEVWRIMLNKEKTYLRDEHFLQRHPLLQARMRAVLLDWLMEVSLTVLVTTIARSFCATAISACAHSTSLKLPGISNVMVFSLSSWNF